MAQDNEDWAAWMEQHGSSLVLLAQQYVGCRADAEDVVHEAFVSFWRSRHQAQDTTAYLYTCVKHAATNWLRARKRRVHRETASARPEVETWFTSDLEKNERQKELLSVMARLPAEQREVLVMKIWGGLSFPQIAVALDISQNTAASRYRYALDKLRAQLAMETTP